MSIRFGSPKQQQTKVTILKASDFSFVADAAITSNTYVPVVSQTFTPTLTNADIFVEVYAVSSVNGSGNDDWFTNITWNGNEIGYNHESFSTTYSGGSRTSNLFPLVGSWYNINTTPYTLAVNAKRGTSDDTLTIKADGSFYVKITEAARA